MHTKTRWRINSQWGLCPINQLTEILTDIQNYYSNIEDVKDVFIAGIEYDDVEERCDISVNYYTGCSMYYQKLVIIDGKLMDGVEFHEMLKERRRQEML